jgi:ParB family transcriptional regulator, chromosome partitioning protein
LLKAKKYDTFNIMDLSTQGPVFLIETERIKPNPHQPRRNFDETGLQELASSIREYGILQPIVVTKLEHITETGTEVEYQLIAGERRWLAAQKAGLERIPAVIRDVNLDKERLELAIIENVQRVNLDPIEAARAFSKLQDQFGLTQREIAARIGKSREVVANTIRLLSLPDPMQEAVSRGHMSESQARLLLTVTEIPQQQSLFEDILKSNMSVRDLRLRIRKLQGQEEQEMKTHAGKSQEVDPETQALQKELEESLGAKVKLERLGETGKLTISFHSGEELFGIISKLRTKQVTSAQEESNISPFLRPENFSEEGSSPEGGLPPPTLMA